MNDSLQSFVDRIHRMNKVFLLPTNPPPGRIEDFCRVLKEEVLELNDALEEKVDEDGNVYLEVNSTSLADCLGDIVVYCFSEAVRWNIPLLDVLHIIMDSQDSKLVNGFPLMAKDGSKFVKGPDFEPPEPFIEQLLIRREESNG